MWITSAFSAFIVTSLQFAVEQSATAAQGDTGTGKTCEHTDVANCIVRGIGDFVEKLQSPSSKLKQFHVSYLDMCTPQHLSACRRQHNMQSCTDEAERALAHLEAGVSSALGVLCANNGTLLHNIVEGLSCWEGNNFFECIRKKNVASSSAGFFEGRLDICSARSLLTDVFRQCAMNDISRQQRCAEKPDTRGIRQLEDIVADDVQCAGGGGRCPRCDTLLSITVGLLAFVVSNKCQ
ncbi:uncharacterized protein [Dermacentor andersoni]|uniref:uncharacterized protein isoform X2 n=1 Tax=Dermacentor andersoni TaxID=34620 RepID=UPI002416FA2B|nr:uncharacterized protein LOC129387050 isoform X2 [Dermacentor andersoni]